MGMKPILSAFFSRGPEGVLGPGLGRVQGEEVADDGHGRREAPTAFMKRRRLTSLPLNMALTTVFSTARSIMSSLPVTGRLSALEPWPWCFRDTPESKGSLRLFTLLVTEGLSSFLAMVAVSLVI